jgi:hypothetical protein
MGVFIKMNNQLPNCFLIGAAKSGTTTLTDLMSQHPEIYIPYAKEPRFFSNDEFFQRGVDWFQETYYSKAGDAPVRLDASTTYLYWSSKVAPRLLDYDKDQNIKIMAIFRNPVQRAYSMYWQMRRDVTVKLSFQEALATEEESFRQNFEAFSYYGKIRYGIFRGGCYASLIKPYLNLFPPERILLLLQDDLLADPDTTLAGVYSFLNVEPIAQKLVASNPAVTARNRKLQGFLLRPSGILRQLLKQVTRHMSHETRYRLKKKIMDLNMRKVKYPPMPEEVADQLRQRYTEEIQQLEKIVNRDLSHWYKK